MLEHRQPKRTAAFYKNKHAKIIKLQPRLRQISVQQTTICKKLFPPMTEKCHGKYVNMVSLKSII